MNKRKIVLDKTNYPLVVENRDKLQFEDWEISGSTVLLHAGILTDEYEETDVIWSVENTDVVSIVSARGAQCEVRGRTTRHTSVTAALPDGSKAECAVVVIQFIGLSDSPIHDVILEQVRFRMPENAHSFQNCINFKFINCDKEISIDENLEL